MTQIAVEPLHAEFGARVSGIDASAPLADETIGEIRRIIDDYSFVLFPNQDMNDERQLAFTRYLGEPEPNHVILGREGRVEYFGTIGNVMEDNRQLGNDHARTIHQTGNNMWHSDSSFREVPSMVSIMAAYEVPAEGGATEFVSNRAGYNRLDDGEKARIDPLVTVHDYVFSRSKVTEVDGNHAASLPPVKQKLVRSNPGNGAKNYYIGSHVREVVGWPVEDGRALLDDLLERTTQTEHIYSHHWQPGDLVIWDNRCLLHRGTGYDADKYRRYMRQTRVQGRCNTCDE